MATDPIVFPFEHNWAVKPVERFVWMTEILTAFSGREQRSKLRLRPRIQIEYSFDVYDREARKFNSILFEHQAKSFTIPFWFDSAMLTSSIGSGVSSIPVTTYGRAFEEGEPAVLWESYLVNEEVTVDTINANSIDITGVTSQAYSSSAVLLPARYGNIAEIINYEDPTAKFRSCKVIFYCDPADYSAISVSWDTFDNHNVFSYWPDRGSNLGNVLSRSLDVLDSGMGVRSLYDRTGYPTIKKTLDYKFSSQQEILELKSYLLSADGQRVPFWFFEDTKDLKVTQTIGAADVTIDIDNIGFTDTGFGEYRNRICIYTSDGNKYYREITNCTEIDDDEERITIDSALGTEYTAAEVLLICFMTLGRLSGDTVEIEYDNINHATASIPIMATYNLGTTTVATTTTTSTTTTSTFSTTTTTTTTNTASTTSTTVTTYPITWNLYDSVNNNSLWQDVCYSEDLTLFVAVASTAGTGSANKVMYSSDGTSWTGVSDLNAYDLYSVCYCPYRNKFYAVGDGPYLHYSSDGINWSTMLITDKDYGYEELDFLFVRIRSQGDLISDNKLILVSRIYGPVIASEKWDGVTLEFEYVRRTHGTPIVYTEPDGTTDTGANLWEAVAVGNATVDYSVMVSSAGYQQVGSAISKGDPVNWGQVLIQSTSEEGLFQDVCFSSDYNRFVAVSSEPDFPFAYTTYDPSSDLLLWVASPQTTGSKWYGVVWAEKFKLFVALSYASGNGPGPSYDHTLYAATSQTGEYWTHDTSSWIDTFTNQVLPNGICYAPDQEIIVAVLSGVSINNGEGKVVVGS